MTKRDIMLSVINHQENVIPSWTMAFFDIDTAKRLLGNNLITDEYEPQKEYKYGASSKENIVKNIEYSNALDNYAIGVGKGANFAFGHCGPGEFLDRIIEEGGDYIISQYETGVKKKTKKNPHFSYSFDYPLQTLDDLSELSIPDAHNANRYAGIEDEIHIYKENGFFTYANLNGIFSAIHYFFYPYDSLFMDMILNKESLKRLIRVISEFNLTAAESILRKGIDCIAFCDDLGDGRSLLFHPELYKELFFPYHKELSDLCHSYGAYVHMHSHGNIKKILPQIVETGIDILNPIDPYEIGAFSEIKDEYGGKITLAGGINKFFFEWEEGPIREYLENLINIGRRNGGFILMDNGGIPENITNDKLNFYLEISRQLRYSDTNQEDDNV